MFAMTWRTYLEASEDADIEKKCALIDDATAFASTVLPLPGGPKNRIPNKEVIRARSGPNKDVERTFWWRANAREEIGPEQRVHNGLLQGPFGVIETDWWHALIILNLVLRCVGTHQCRQMSRQKRCQ